MKVLDFGIARADGSVASVQVSMGQAVELRERLTTLRLSGDLSHNRVAKWARTAGNFRQI